MPFQFCLLLVEVVVQLHHLPLPVFCLTLPLVPLPQGPQLLLLDLDGKLVQAFGEGRHVLVQGDDFGDELHGQTLEMI